MVNAFRTRLGPDTFTTLWFFEPFPSSFGQIGRDKGGNIMNLPTDEDAIVWVGGASLNSSYLDSLDLAYAHNMLQHGLAP